MKAITVLVLFSLMMYVGFSFMNKAADNLKHQRDAKVSLLSQINN